MGRGALRISNRLDPHEIQSRPVRSSGDHTGHTQSELEIGRTPEEVPLTAAHEMGHVLGPPHSDSHRDVVYPTNTARSLTPRDFRTVEALYRLPNGARIRRGPWQSFLSVETVLLDLLVEVGPGHTDPAGRLAHVPIVGAKFVCDVGHLGVLLELAETFKVEQRRA